MSYRMPTFSGRCIALAAAVGWGAALSLSPLGQATTALAGENGTLSELREAPVPASKGRAHEANGTSPSELAPAPTRATTSPAAVSRALADLIVKTTEAAGPGGFAAEGTRYEEQPDVLAAPDPAVVTPAVPDTAPAPSVPPAPSAPAAPPASGDAAATPQTHPGHATHGHAHQPGHHANGHTHPNSTTDPAPGTGTVGIDRPGDAPTTAPGNSQGQGQGQGQGNGGTRSGNPQPNGAGNGVGGGAPGSTGQPGNSGTSPGQGSGGGNGQGNGGGRPNQSVPDTEVPISSGGTGHPAPLTPVTGPLQAGNLAA